VTRRVLKIIADNQKERYFRWLPRKARLKSWASDSMDAVNIVFEIENHFSVNVPDEEMKNIRSVRDIVEGVHKLVAGKPPDGPEKAAA